jgi:hypothetical protein
MIHIDLPKDRPGVRALGAYLKSAIAQSTACYRFKYNHLETLRGMLHVRQIQAIDNRCQLQVANQNKRDTDGWMMTSLPGPAIRF